MRRINLILLLLGLLLAVGMVRAQEETVSLYIDDSLNLPFTTYSNYVETLTHHLNSIGVNLVLSEGIAEANLVLRINQSEFRENLFDVFLETRTFPIFPETNILYPVPENPLWLLEGVSEADIAEYLDTEAVQLSSTYLALYSIQQCSVANNNRPALAEMVEYFGLTRGKTVDFYVGNCAMIENDIDTAYQYLSYSASYTVQPFINDQHALVNLSWIYVTYDFEWHGFEGWNNSASSPIELIGYYECDRFEGPCWAGIGSNITNMATKVIPVEKQIELITKRAQLYALAFDYDSAIADMDEAITLAEENEADNTTLAELYTIRGQIVFLLYEWDRVLADFNHAIELDPNYAPAYFQRGVLYYTMTQRENALADFEHYLELEPDGLYAEEATQYIESIQIELEALGG